MALLFRSLLFALSAMLATCTTTTDSSAATPSDAVDNYIVEQMKKDNIPGLALAVVKGGKIVKAKGYGLANLELQVPATADTVFEIGSITKQFTATAIMMLAEQGKLSLDDKISKHVSGTPQVWQGVTVRHLLYHTSGIKAYTSVEGFERTAFLPTTHEEVVKFVAPYPLEFDPGEKWIIATRVITCWVSLSKRRVVNPTPTFCRSASSHLCR
jgi:CubicO group peptidase (beta-lactamase class C family)